MIAPAWQRFAPLVGGWRGVKMHLPRRMGLARLSVLAVLVGAVTGLGAVLFRALIGTIHNLAFLGELSAAYDANLFTPPSPWGAFIILVPVIGGMVVTFLVTTFAPEARGHGVPEVMDAIYYGSGVIRPVVAVIKSLASAISIATGAAVGREGPIIQIGASLGSTLGQIVRMAAWQRITLVAAGAGAGIAATFNTPIGGVMFAIELMMPELSARTFLPVALSTGTATFVGRIFLGLRPAFDVPSTPMSEGPASVSALGVYALLGLLMGLAAVAFIRALSAAEDIFDRIHNPYGRHALGMLMIGVLMYALLAGAGHYYVEGVGYATIQAILAGHLAFPALLALLFIAKLFATSVSLGSGASGGIFSPSLFMGATLGGAFGGLVAGTYPIAGISVASCAMIGMAAIVGGGTGAAMTAVTMIFEMTRDYDLVMPIIIAVALAIGVRRLISQENIYTVKLVARRHFVPKALHANMFLVRRATDVMERTLVRAPAEADLASLVRAAAADSSYVVVTRGDRISGVVRIDPPLAEVLLAETSPMPAGQLAKRQFILAREDDVVFDIVARMARHKAHIVLVTRRVPRPRAADLLGVITRDQIADSVIESVIPYG